MPAPSRRAVSSPLRGAKARGVGRSQLPGFPQNHSAPASSYLRQRDHGNNKIQNFIRLSCGTPWSEAMDQALLKLGQIIARML